MGNPGAKVTSQFRLCPGYPLWLGQGCSGGRRLKTVFGFQSLWQFATCGSERLSDQA